MVQNSLESRKDPQIAANHRSSSEREADRVIAMEIQINRLPRSSHLFYPTLTKQEEPKQPQGY